MRRRILVVAVTALVLATAPARGQEPALEVFYSKLEPQEPFKYKWKGQAAVANAGVFRWEVPETEFGTNGLDRNFTGYCAEVLVPITAGKLYRFRVNSLYATTNYNLADDDRAVLAAERRTRYVQELFGRFYRDPITKPANPAEALALQVALWEVIQETEPAEGEPARDLFAGDFQADYDRANAPAYVLKAQGYLDALTGNDALFYENPDLRGRELIRLMGIENAEKVVAQSQFALRFAGGGGVGAGSITRALTGGVAIGGVPVGGSAAPGGGGGGGGIATTPGNNGSPPSPDNPTAQANPPPPGDTSTIPPARPPVRGEEPPTGGPGEGIPIPAPGGLVLGGIALAAVSTWRFAVRRLGR